MDKKIERDSFTYAGPVYLYDRIILNNWHANTIAASINRAKVNLEYQYKKEYGLASTSNIQIDINKIIRKRSEKNEQ